jgi:hypothetical protein
MSEKPIIFSTPMVEAILAGRKTQTRRVVKRWNQADGIEQHDDCYQGEFVPWKDGEPQESIFAPAELGDVLWVRESFRQAWPATSYSHGIVYRADKAKSLGMDEYSERHRWKPSIHMPRLAARLFLRVTDVRVERLQDIREADALAEGCDKRDSITVNGERYSALSALDSFESLWQSLNAERGYGWGRNPWVWVIEFEPLPEGDTEQ